jgi:hypothetical protein
MVQRSSSALLFAACLTLVFGTCLSVADKVDTDAAPTSINAVFFNNSPVAMQTFSRQVFLSLAPNGEYFTQHDLNVRMAEGQKNGTFPSGKVIDASKFDLNGKLGK